MATLTIPNAVERAGWEQPTSEWIVLHTKSRQEKVVAEHLAGREIDHFLPLLPQVRYYGKRKAVVDLPLFPGYVFLWGTIEQAWEADRTRRLVQIIPVPDQAKLDWELSQIRKALSVDAPLEPFPYLQAGVRVEVRSGPMRGLQGVIESRAKPQRLILKVDMLGRALGVEVDASLLDVLD